MRHFLKLGFFGAAGGAINVTLCYLRLPVPVHEDPGFAWHVVPAGASHGAVLAAVAFCVASAMSRRCVMARLVVAPAVGWVAAFVAWIPLHRSAFDQSWPTSLTWPFHGAWQDALWVPFAYFGLVAFLFYLAVCFLYPAQVSPARSILLVSAAGIMGSLWWWIELGPWYFSPLHGAIWGTCVGTAAWMVWRGEGAVTRRTRSE